MQSGTDRINKKRTLERGERGLRLQSPRLIVSGVTGKRGKKGKRRERKKKSNNRREEEDNKEADLLQLAAVPTTACFCKLARIYFFKEGAQHPQEKYVRSPNDVDSSTTATTSKISPPPPRFFTLTSLRREELRARNKRTDHFVERDWVWWWSWKMLWMGEIRDFSLRRMEKIVIWIYKSKSGENYNKWAPYKA